MPETKEDNAVRMRKARAQATPKVKEDDAIRKRKARVEENLDSKKKRQCVDKQSRREARANAQSVQKSTPTK